MIGKPANLLRITGALAYALTACQYLVVRLAGGPGQNITVLETILAAHIKPTAFLLIEQASIWLLLTLFWQGTAQQSQAAADRRRIIFVGLQVLVATLSAGDLLPLVAAQAGLLLPGKAGRIWIGAQMTVQLVVCTLLPGALAWMQPAMLSKLTGDYAAPLQLASIPIFHLLAYSLGLLGAVEARQRQHLIEAHSTVLEANDELRRLNAELTATQKMEAQAARIAERMTIAREVHDALGHHLAALSVNLQLATRLDGPKARKPVEEAYLLARMLLSDIRTLVTDLKELDAASLREAIETMAASISHPTIHIDFDEGLEQMGALPGHTLFRCAQEAITNAVRHAEANNLWIRISRNAGGYHFTARDDGRGAMDVFFGHGLKGMQERVQELGGVMKCETRLGSGFFLEVHLPGKQVAA